MGSHCAEHWCNPKFYALDRLFIPDLGLARHRSHASHICVHRFERLRSAMTIFVLGAHSRSVPICTYFYCLHKIVVNMHTVVTPQTTVYDIMEILWRRGLIPSTYLKTHLLFSSTSSQPLNGSESMGTIGVGSLSHLYLRVRCLGGAKELGTIAKSRYSCSS
jgi:hypothetical protein